MKLFGKYVYYLEYTFPYYSLILSVWTYEKCKNKITVPNEMTIIQWSDGASKVLHFSTHHTIKAWRYNYMYFWPWHQMVVSSQFHVPTAFILGGRTFSTHWISDHVGYGTILDTVWWGGKSWCPTGPPFYRLSYVEVKMR